MATRQSEEAAKLLRSALNALPLQVAVLDAEGVIRYTNRAWRTFRTANGLEEPVGEGTDYLGVCEAAGPEGRTAAEGIRAVLRGDRDEFSLEYDCHGPDRERWFLMRATRFEAPVDGPSGGTSALVAHNDVTDRKLAERAAEAGRSRRRTPGSEAETGPWVDERVPVDVGTLARSAWADLGVDRSGASLIVDGTRRIDADQRLLARLLEAAFRAAVDADGVVVEVAPTDDGFAVLDDGDPLVDRGGATRNGRAVVERVAAAHGWSVERTERVGRGVRLRVRVDAA